MICMVAKHCARHSHTEYYSITALFNQTLCLLISQKVEIDICIKMFCLEIQDRSSIWLNSSYLITSCPDNLIETAKLSQLDVPGCCIQYTDPDDIHQCKERYECLLAHGWSNHTACWFYKKILETIFWKMMCVHVFMSVCVHVQWNHFMREVRHSAKA